MHNLGEGLAIGTSFALGELTLGTFLIVGFMIHNVTEGLGIATPASEGRPTPLQLGGLALLAGRAGDPGRVDRRLRGERRAGRAVLRGSRPVPRSRSSSRSAATSPRRAPGGLRSGWAIGGFLAGIAVMWATGLLVG